MATKEVKNAIGTEIEKPEKKNTRYLQTACPIHTLQEAIKIPQAIKDNYAGQATDPMLVAAACGFSPASSSWRTLTGAAVAYGLMDNGYNSKLIGITPLGERIVSPLIEGDDVVAKKEATLLPTVLKAFFTQYDRNKFPREDIAKNVLSSKGVPADRLKATYNIIRENGQFTGLIHILTGNEYVRLSTGNGGQNPEETIQPVLAQPVLQSESIQVDKDDKLPDALLERMEITPPSASKALQMPLVQSTPRIFITHGKNKTIVGQLKELLSYGQLEPVISVERETTAIPVPDKVFDDMRSCTAGIIHVDLEQVSDGNGNMYSKLNENVLIEIGAAIALYGKKVVILCKTGTDLPSNLQGLYRCEYNGDQLDYAATMKLLKTMKELRSMM